MRARRYRVIALGAVLAVAGAIVPLATMAYVSWQLAIDKELSVLHDVGQRAVERATQTYREARAALQEIEASTFERCAPTHIASMRLLTLNTDVVSEIDYLEGGLIKCSSWGRVARTIRQPAPAFQDVDGLNISFDVRPVDGIAQRMTALQLGSHIVLVSPSQFTSVAMMPQTSLALFAGSGYLVSSRNGIDPAFATRHLAGDQRGVDADLMFARVERDGIKVVVSQPISVLHAGLWSEFLLLLPVGLFISAFIVGIVIFMSKRRLSPRAELEIAVQRREFIVHYQPIIDLATGVCVGAEALVRWRRPNGTIVRPDLFIPLAEETGLIKPITDLVVDAIIEELGAVLVRDRGLHVALNLCADDIRSGRFIGMLDKKLAGTGIRKEQIFLEATERGFVEIDAARETLTRARAAGHTVAIDDFGTGYSSLQYLQGLPMDALKIDKSFVDTIGRGTATSSVTLHIIDMARELGLLSVAEGVETEEQADYLRKHGVDYGQGWLFSRPLDAQSFIAFHKASRVQYGPAPEIIRAAA